MKKGVSLVTAIIAVSIMMILVSSVSIIGSSAISSANFEEYKSQIERVSDEINIYINEKDMLPITNQSVSIDSLGQDFLSEVKEKNDLSNRFYVIDVSKLGDYSIEKGKGDLNNKDVFLLAENTNNLYYLKGFKYRGKVYFTY